MQLRRVHDAFSLYGWKLDTNPWLYKNLPYSPERSFEPVGVFSESRSSWSSERIMGFGVSSSYWTTPMSTLETSISGQHGLEAP
jgi:hypothetical protein